MAHLTSNATTPRAAPYERAASKPVVAFSLLVGSIAIMGFGAPPTSGAPKDAKVELPLFGTSSVRTQSYVVVEEPFEVPAALSTIRRLTGFRMEELAQHFGVTRRAVHDWASGKPLSRKNEDAVKALLGQVREHDTGSPAATRSLLIAAANGQAAHPLFQPERQSASVLNRRARDKITTAGGPLLAADQSAPDGTPPKLIKRVPITVKKT